jgi:hypothetical protein
MPHLIVTCVRMFENLLLERTNSALLITVSACHSVVEIFNDSIVLVNKSIH